MAVILKQLFYVCCALGNCSFKGNYGPLGQGNYVHKQKSGPRGIVSTHNAKQLLRHQMAVILKQLFYVCCALGNCFKRSFKRSSGTR